MPVASAEEIASTANNPNTRVPANHGRARSRRATHGLERVALLYAAIARKTLLPIKNMLAAN